MTTRPGAPPFASRWNGTACRRGSAATGRQVWRDLDRLLEILWPTTKRLREAKEAVSTEEEGATLRLEAGKEEYDFAFALSPPR